MPVVVVTPPDPIISLAEAKKAIRVDYNDDDDLIEALIAAVTQAVDAPNGWLGRALGLQTLELRAAHFPGCCWHGHACFEPHFEQCLFHTGQHVVLPFRPVRSIVSIKYLDLAGVLQTMDPTAYSLSDDVLMPVFGTVWPAARLQPGAVQIQYTAGYPDGVPELITTALKLMLAPLYDTRGNTPAVVSGVAEVLLNHFWVVH
ncbi:head-tail connector protein [Lichenihabitans psoromatis]|uniref:head-tail connector protein n=1 Tax=Lichenihabitans psoromatis TaxID=2528642 RepID=UPI001038311C|nr:head-tail connector protein [Lichenihabitans psoromatis]